MHQKIGKHEKTGNQNQESAYGQGEIGIEAGNRCKSTGLGWLSGCEPQFTEPVRAVEANGRSYQWVLWQGFTHIQNLQWIFSPFLLLLQPILKITNE